MGFVQSISDPSVFMSAEVVCLVYIDDTLLFYESKQAMESLKQKMRDDGMLFYDEKSFAGYLGVLIDRRKDSTIHLTQKGLVVLIVEAIYLNDKRVDPVDTLCTKFLPLINLAALLMDNSVTPPLLDNSITYKDIHNQISLWQPPSVHVMFIIQNDLTN